MSSTLDDIYAVLCEIRDELHREPRMAAPGRALPTPLTDGAVFPNYGRRKGAPVRGAAKGDLEFYAEGCRRSLADSSKARWHDKEQRLLNAIEAELARHGGDTPPPAPSQMSSPDDDIPF